MNNLDDLDKSGWLDDPYYEKEYGCRDPQHNPPTHLWIPPGKMFRHVCPRCGVATIMRGSDVRLCVR